MMPTRPVVVRAAPAIPRVPAFRLPSASPASCDWPAVESFHLHSVMQRLVAHWKKSQASMVAAWALAWWPTRDPFVLGISRPRTLRENSGPLSR